MDTERTGRIVVRLLGLLSIVVGMLSLLGFRQMNSRATELVLGSAALLAGITLLAISSRQRGTEEVSG